MTGATIGFLLGGLFLGAGGCGTSGSGSIPPPPAAFTTIDAPGAGTTMALGTLVQDINTEGDTVGYFTKAPSDLGHAFVRTADGVLTVVNIPGQGTQNRQGATAWRINSAGTIVGYFVDQQSVTHGFIRTLGGNITTFDAPGATATYATAINDSGAVAGLFIDNTLARSAFIRNPDGTFTAFPNFASDTVSAETLSVGAINTSGLAIGSFQTFCSTSGFLGNPDGTFSVFDAPGAGEGDCSTNTTTTPTDINAQGVIVGAVSLVGPAVGFMRTPAGVFTNITGPTKTNHGSSPTGINDSGVIVGIYTDASNSTHGYLRSTDGTLSTIDDPLAATGPNSTGTFITHINSSGAIVGFYVDAQGTRHGFLRQ